LDVAQDDDDRILQAENREDFMTEVVSLDDPERHDELRRLILGKPALRRFYDEIYGKYRACLKQAPQQGVALEIGSGAGFSKEAIPELTTSDVLPYPGVDQVIDATRMPFEDGSLRAIFMLNVFHHIPNVRAFFAEAARCLKPGGRILIVDEHPGVLGHLVLKYVHHEPYDPRTDRWEFETSGPLSGANGALAWIVFQRDRARFEKEFPQLELQSYRPHTPFRYWLSGGLKSWSMLPGWAFGAATQMDRALTTIWPDLGCFVDIELVRR